ncbi:MAG TPA: AAA family ATPase, partial [Thermoanaerobaculia bacterium]|nr:AAA family ATPase [Thermoanaerobaculia bacterium]
MSQETSGSHFERLVLRNVRCFRDAEIELDPKVTVLIGENGSGKTTLMEALASLAYGEEEG